MTTQLGKALYQMDLSIRKKDHNLLRMKSRISVIMMHIKVQIPYKVNIRVHDESELHLHQSQPWRKGGVAAQNSTFDLLITI
jgi:hypothetical protein